ncbi:MAG TPA: NUDIX hydrolase [Candidatus Saccharimonadales bacterium]|nr:NUDIX hydrolase [Candidatus Saccharimonadales bacterium]
MMALGRLAYFLLRPFLRLYLARTTRVYGLITSEGQVLAVKNWLGRQAWSLPGGGVRPSESSRLALCREIKEETSLSINPKQLRPLSQGRWQTDNLGFKYIVMQAEISRIEPVRRQWPEVVTAGWITPAQLTKAGDVELITTLKLANLI